MFCWLPNHVGIRGNEAAGRATKGALTSAVSIAEVLASDWKPKAIQFVQNIRNRNWEEVQSNKLKEIVPNLKEHQQLQSHNRRDKVVLTRLQIGHSRLTHSFLLKGEPSPECFGCNTWYTLKHILFRMCKFLPLSKIYLTLAYLTLTALCWWYSGTCWISTCCDTWHLSVNTDKTKVVIFLKEK